MFRGASGVHFLFSRMEFIRHLCVFFTRRCPSLPVNEAIALFAALEPLSIEEAEAAGCE